MAETLLERRYDRNWKASGVASSRGAMLEDKCLLHKLRQGGGEALALAMDGFLGMVHSLALGMLGSDADAEDVCQEVFLRLHRASGRLREGTPLRLWLCRTCLNCCRDELRRQARRAALPSDALLDSLPSDSADPEEVAGEHEFFDRVAGCLRRLPPRQRAVFAMKHWTGLTIQEISKVLGCAPGTVKCHLSRAVVALWDAMSGEWGQVAGERSSNEPLP
jgi:RNA polymerase sigma-70 factor (ECF subfamily)